MPEFEISAQQREEIENWTRAHIKQGKGEVVATDLGGDTYKIGDEPLVLHWRMENGDHGRQELLLTSHSVLRRLKADEVYDSGTQIDHTAELLGEVVSSADPSAGLRPE